MEKVDDKKIKFIMDTDWLIQEPIDFEHKKYVLLGYFKKIDQLLDQNKIYPTFIELSLHLASLQTMLKEHYILYTEKEFKSYDDEVLLKDLMAKELPILSKEEFSELDHILKFSSSKFFEYFSIVKSFWTVIYDTISVSIKKNKKFIKNGVGFMTHTNKKTGKIYVWEYKIKEVSSEYNEHNADLVLIYDGDKKNHTFNEIVETYSNIPEKDRKECPVFDMKTTEEYPLEETLIPLFKRKLMSYIFQSVRIDTIKKFDN